MVGANLKAETVAMVEKRAELEAEMNVIIARLCAPGGPGISGNLVDAEGFPRADIDIPAIRADRHHLAVLHTDHKEVTDKIERNISILHSGSSGVKLPQKRAADIEELTHERIGSAYWSDSAMDMQSSSNTGQQGLFQDVHSLIPFALFDEVQEGSPAALDGILVGDQLLKFGEVEGGENVLPRLAREGQMNEGNAIPVLVMRRGTCVQLTVTPRRWVGSGLLGCHIRPL